MTTKETNVKVVVCPSYLIQTYGRGLSPNCKTKKNPVGKSYVKGFIHWVTVRTRSDSLSIKGQIKHLPRKRDRPKHVSPVKVEE